MYDGVLLINSSNFSTFGRQNIAVLVSLALVNGCPIGRA